MRKGWSLLLVAACGTARAEEAAEPKVVGRLSAKEGLTLAGRVLGGDGPVNVTLWRYEFDETGQWYHRTEAVRVVVPPGGQYRFDGLAPGRYECGLDQAFTFAAANPDVLLVRDVLDRDLRVPSNCRLKGKVTRLHPELKSTIRVSLGRFAADADAAGAFETPDVAPGDYRAEITESWRVEGAMGFSELRRSVPVRLDGGVKTLDFEMTDDVPLPISVRSNRKEESFDGRYGAESGVVRFHDGWFRVLGHAVEPPMVQRLESFRPMGEQGWGEAAVDFDIGGAPAGRHVVRLTALGFAPWEKEVQFDLRAQAEAVMTALPGQYVVPGPLPSVARVEVRPLRGDGAWREIFACDRRLQAIHGPYEPPLRAFLEPGRYQWRAESIDGAPTTAAELVVTDARDVATLAPVFAPGATLRGRLATKSGHALGGSRLRFAVLEDGQWRVLPTKDAHASPRGGVFEVKGLSPGRWRACLDDECAVVLAEFEVKAADVSRDLVFAPR